MAAQDPDHAKRVPEVEDLAEQIGSFIAYWGFKKVHGHVWCRLFLARTPLDASSLMAILGISKALVSVTLKELLEFGVIVETGKSERGTRLYAAVDDVAAPIIDTLRRRERRMLSRIESAQGLLEGLSEQEQTQGGLDSGRIVTLGQLIRIAAIGLDQLIKGGGVLAFPPFLAHLARLPLSDESKPDPSTPH